MIKSTASRTILGKAPPRNPSHKVHLAPATGKNLPAVLPLPAPLSNARCWLTPSLPGGPFEDRETQPRKPNAGGQGSTHSKQHTLPPHSMSSNLFRAPVKSTALTDHFGKSPSRNSISQMHLLPTTGTQVSSVCFPCCRLTPSCPEAFRGTAKKQPRKPHANGQVHPTGTSILPGRPNFNIIRLSA